MFVSSAHNNAVLMICILTTNGRYDDIYRYSIHLFSASYLLSPLIFQVHHRKFNVKLENKISLLENSLQYQENFGTNGMNQSPEVQSVAEQYHRDKEVDVFMMTMSFRVII